MQADLSIEVAKVILLLLMFVVAGAAAYLGNALNSLIRPISRQLIELHKGDAGGLEPRLQYIRQRYIALLSHVDNIDTAEFSAGEIERLSLRILGREVTAANCRAGPDFRCPRPGCGTGGHHEDSLVDCRSHGDSL